jgi:imidazolonepropionase-like amidohydrolase
MPWTPDQAERHTPAWFRLITRRSWARRRCAREKQILAVPTFTIFEYFADHAENPSATTRQRAIFEYHTAEFKKQMAAGISFAVGSDVGPFPHGTQARELVLMAKFGMPPLVF